MTTAPLSGLPSDTVKLDVCQSIVAKQFSVYSPLGTIPISLHCEFCDVVFYWRREEKMKKRSKGGDRERVERVRLMYDDGAP